MSPPTAIAAEWLSPSCACTIVSMTSKGRGFGARVGLLGALFAAMLSSCGPCRVYCPCGLANPSDSCSACIACPDAQADGD